MIVFNLKCAEGHGFEEWFASSADYETKAAARALVCPECGSAHIEKGLSALRINGGAQAPAPAAGPCGLPACAAVSARWRTDRQFVAMRAGSAS